MHENRVAHRWFSLFSVARSSKLTRPPTFRDACSGNLTMDATRLIPNGFHFAAPYSLNGSIRQLIQARSRSSVAPVEYFFIDFGVSYMQSSFNPDPMGHSIVGQDRTVPEFLDKVAAYDPYKVDIYQLGNAIARRIVEVR